jgi:hypothetical protein
MFLTKIVKGAGKLLFGSGPAVKVEGISDQLQDRYAERLIGAACILVALALVIFSIRGCS